MSRRAVLIIACVLLMLLLTAAGAVGFLLNKPFRSESAGQHRASPNGKWVAHALTARQRTLFGPRRTFSELRIETASPSRRILRRMVVEDTSGSPIDWDIEGELFWVRNSSAVTFKCVTGGATLDVTLPVEH